MKAAAFDSIAAILAALGGSRKGECFCGECKPQGQAEWLASTKEHVQIGIESNTQSLKILNEEATRDGLNLIGINSGAIKLGGKDTHHHIMTYGKDGSDSYMLIHRDSRKSEDSIYNVHGLEAAEAVTESIRESLIALAESEPEAAPTGA